MSESTEAFQSGTYSKGDQYRVVESTAGAVQAVFDGFVRVPDEQINSEPEPAEQSPTPPVATPGPRGSRTSS